MGKIFRELRHRPRLGDTLFVEEFDVRKSKDLQDLNLSGVKNVVCVSCDVVALFQKCFVAVEERSYAVMILQHVWRVRKVSLG